MRFDALIDRFPEEGERAARRLEELASGRGRSEYTFSHLEHELEPVPRDILALMLAFLQQHGAVERLVRVESQVGRGGIGDFRSVTEVPEEIHDPLTDTYVQVTPENLVVIYRFQGA